LDAPKLTVLRSLEDLILAVFLLELHREVCFLDLAFVGAFGGQQAVFDELLREGAAALHAVVHEVADERADEAFDVHPGMVVEAYVLDGDHGSAAAAETR
jgi:hypothetical protein